MKLWMVLLVAGQVQATTGPLPATVGECVAAAVRLTVSAVEQSKPHRYACIVSPDRPLLAFEKEVRLER